MQQKSTRLAPRLMASVGVSLSTLLFAPWASAGLVAEASATQGSESEQILIEAENGELARINFPRQAGQNYMLIRDGGLYMVTDQQGDTMVMDMADFFEMASMIGDSAAPEVAADDIAEVISLADTGRDETVAGIQGDVYELAWIDGTGNRRDDEIVLSSDPRARAFTQVWVNLVESLGQLSDSTEGADDLRARLEGEGKGFLRMGDEFALTALREDDFADGHFELPAPVTDMAALMGGGAAVGGGPASRPAEARAAEAEQSDEGLFGGIFSRQKERAEDRAEQRTEQEVDSAVDKAVDGAIRGLFGR